jgi:2-dehydropantoate 2-reductase
VRYVVVGAGAIGGTVGGRLFQHGHEVVLVARGEHRRALTTGGLRLATPDGEPALPVPVAGGPEDVALRGDDVLVLATKTQDTAGAVRRWAAAPVAGGGTAGQRLAVVCAQNGVENERLALRWFRRVYGACVWMPATFLRPGLVVAPGEPVSGVFELGRYPRGLDETAERISADLSASLVATEPRADVMPWKYAKLLGNLSNALDALCGPAGDWRDLGERAVAEGQRVVAAAGVEPPGEDERWARWAVLERADPLPGHPPSASSSWQSLARGTGTLETDYLNGEIVLLGRRHGVPTPVNETVQQVAGRAAADGVEPGSVSPDSIRRLLAAIP